MTKHWRGGTFIKTQKGLPFLHIHAELYMAAMVRLKMYMYLYVFLLRDENH